MKQYVDIQVYKAGQAGKVQGPKTTINQGKKLPMECAQGDQPVRCPNRCFCLHEPAAVPSAWRFGGGRLCFRGASVVVW